MASNPIAMASNLISFLLLVAMPLLLVYTVRFFCKLPWTRGYVGGRKLGRTTDAAVRVLKPRLHAGTVNMFAVFTPLGDRAQVRMALTCWMAFFVLLGTVSGDGLYDKDR